MDRNDYKNLISEAKALMKSGGEADALDLLDGVNWRKIHNVNALIEISNLYEQLGHIEDSRMLLTFAHERSPIGRMILYHLTLVCVKMDDIDEAEKYLDEFVQIAPHDSKKYILRYNIAKAKGADIKEQITILEEMKNSDFIEEWAFELAYLYYKAGEADKCIALCDEIVIWFGDGPYVTKALELKMLYSPLDDEQAEKYQDLTRKKKGVTHFKRNEMLESGEVIHHDIDIATVEETPGHLNTVNLQAEIKRNIEEIMEATKEGEVSDNLENIKELIEEIPYLQEKETLDDVANKQKKDNKELGTSIKNQFKELLEEDNDGQMSLFVPEEDEVEEQVEGQITIQDVMDNWAKTQRAAEEVLENAEDMKLKKAKQNAIEEASHIMNKLEGVMPRLEAGVTPSELMKEEVMTQADEARAAEEEAIEAEAASQAKELEAPRADAKDVEELEESDATKADEAKGDKDAVSADEAKAAEEAEIAARIKEFTDKKANADAEKVNAAKAEINKEPKQQETNKVPDQQEANKEPAEKESHTYTVPKFAADGTRIDDGLKIPVIEPVGKNVFGKENANEEGPALIKDNMPNWHPPVLSEEEIKNSNILRNKENEVQLEEASKVVAELNESLQKRIDETVKSKAEEQPIEEEIATEEEVVEEEVPATVEEVVEEEVPATVEEEAEEEELEIDPLEMEEEPLEEPEIELSLNVSEPEVQRIPANWETSKTKVLPQINFSEGNHLSQQIDEDDEDEYVQDPFEEDLEEADINDDGDIDEVERLADATLRESVDDLFRSSDNLDVEEDEGDDMEDSTPRNLTATVSQDDDNAIILTQEEKNIFSYFMPIDGMEQSICKALYNTRNYLKGKTDTGGHIIVQGIQGSGKTMLATSMVKVLQSQISLPAGNVGKVDGDKLNGKDIGKLFSKIQGGCLIIEKAGEINRETAIRLSLMMDNDTSGILIILEDSKIGIERLMKLSAKLSQEFTEKIVIPPFTIDELVGFAKKYATDCECVIDEMGILALYDRINIIQSLDHPTALEEVKVIMDEAMENADKGGFKFPFGRFAAKKYDENGFMILREKNFQN